MDIEKVKQYAIAGAHSKLELKEKEIDRLRESGHYDSPDMEVVKSIVATIEKDIEELEKLHEPRVLTLDEVRNSEGKALFLECCVNIGGKISSTWCSWALYKNDDTEYCVFADTGFASNTHHQIDKYGKDWRCWTAKPTDEQRTETPWEPTKEGCVETDKQEVLLGMRKRQYKEPPCEDVIWNRFIGSALTDHKTLEDYDAGMKCPKCNRTIFGHYEWDGRQFFFTCNECGEDLDTYTVEISQAAKEHMLSEGVWK